MHAANTKRFLLVEQLPGAELGKQNSPGLSPLALSAKVLVNKIMSGAAARFNNMFKIQGRAFQRQKESDTKVETTCDH